MNIGVILLTIVGLIFATRAVGEWELLSEGAVAIGFSAYALYKVITPFGKRGEKSEKLLKRIMSGELNDVEEIQKAWLSKK